MKSSDLTRRFQGHGGLLPWIIAVGLCLCPHLALAGTSPPSPAPPSPTPQSVEDLQPLSIEDLGNLQVTSVSKRPETLRQVAAAIYVITSDDIRRSGATSLTEVLRLAPNLEVARVNGFSANVTARGFNSVQASNKLLVLIDGRSVYEPVSSGVPWQMIDVALDDIDRIEVISGPGGTMWGANAVNGVINIITKDASQTQGFFLRATSGIYKRSASLRYGGKLGRNASYRVFADGFKSDGTQNVTPTHPSDAFMGAHGGFAIDGTGDSTTYSVRGDGYDNTAANNGGNFHGYDILGNWEKTLVNGSTVALGAYFAHDIRAEPNFYESRDTYNIEGQQTIAIGQRHQFVWGGEMRLWRENFTSHTIARFANPKADISLGSVFAQDEITLKRGLKLTLGLKAETNSYSGVDWLPNVRLAWQRGNGDLVWGAMSRAVRTPNRLDRELEAPGLILPSPDFRSEKLNALELGWRTQPTVNSSFSLAAFYNVYDDLRTIKPTPVTVVPAILENGARGTTYGLEGWGKVDVTPRWRVSGGFNLLHKHFETKPGTVDANSLRVQGEDPAYQGQLRSEWTVTDKVDLDIAMRTVGKIDNAPVPAYTEATVHVGWRVRDNIELAVNAVNLLHARHLESWSSTSLPPYYVGRSIVLSLRYGY